MSTACGTEKVPCETCGKLTNNLGTKRCDSCWEVESRLPHYLQSPRAIEVVRNLMPKLEDWVDGKPDAWDYEAVLQKHRVTVGVTQPGGNDWVLFWRHGTMGIGADNEVHAKKAAALFVELWLRGVSASFADKLMDGFLYYLEVQERGGKAARQKRLRGATQQR